MCKPNVTGGVRTNPRSNHSNHTDASRRRRAGRLVLTSSRRRPIGRASDDPLFCHHHRARARFAGDSCDRDRLGQRPGSIPGHQGPSRRDFSVPGHRTTVSTCGDPANLTVERRSPGRGPGARRPPDRSERYDIELVRGRSKDELGEESVH
jgi:hypothetical protein